MPRIGFPSLTPAVKWLLIINVAVFFINGKSHWLDNHFAATGATLGQAVQVWRLLTFQFLHADGRHLIGNMLGLYFLGTIIERSWGSKQFVIFYLTSGAVGGIVYVLVSLTLNVFGGELVGASGGVLAILVTCAILFPQIKILLFFIIPVGIRIIAVVLAGWYVLNVYEGGWNAGGDLCHLGGMAMGFLWIYAGPQFRQIRQRQAQASRQRQQSQQAEQEFEVDRILAKVHQQGIHSLTRREKEILRRATEQQKQQSGR